MNFRVHNTINIYFYECLRIFLDFFFELFIFFTVMNMEGYSYLENICYEPYFLGMWLNITWPNLNRPVH